MKFAHKSLAFSALGLLFFSCSKKSNDNIDCLAIFPPVYLDFNVVDAGTDKDLFFSTGSPLDSKDIYFFRSHDKRRNDTIYPSIEGVGQDRFFRVSPNIGQLKDTMSLTIDDFLEDHLFFTFKNTEERCPKIIISEVSMNDKKLKEENGRIIIRK